MLSIQKLVPEHDNLVDVERFGHPALPGPRVLVVREQVEVKVIPEDLAVDVLFDIQLALVLGLEVLGEVRPPEGSESALFALEVKALEVARVQVVQDREVLRMLERAVVALVVTHRPFGVHNDALQVGQVVRVFTGREK